MLISLFLYYCFTFFDSLPDLLRYPVNMYHQYLGTPQRSFLQAIIWISVGSILSSKELLKIRLTKTCLVYGGGILMVINLLLSLVWTQFLVLGVVAFIMGFYPILKNNKKEKVLSVCRTMRQCSIIIYCIHYPILHMVWQTVPVGKFGAFGIALIGSCSLALLIVQLSRIKLLKFLY